MNKAAPTEDEVKLAKKIAARLGASWFVFPKNLPNKVNPNEGDVEPIILEEIMQYNRQTTEEAYADPNQLPLGLVENDWE